MEQTLGKRIMANRKRLGLTQDQLAEQLEVSAQAVSKWENDQTCPDIAMLPRLAEIFGISTDVLLGRQEQVFAAEVVNNTAEENTDGVHVKKGKWQFQWNGGKLQALGMAVFVLLVGGLYLTVELLQLDISFWSILWPSALLTFGLFGLFSKFSFFFLGSTLFGGYFLVDQFVDLPIPLEGGVIWAVMIVLFGLSLLADALRKPKKPQFKVHYHKEDAETDGEASYEVEGDSFSYHASFGENTQEVEMPLLEYGQIHTSFGSYTVDLTGVETVTPDCHLDIQTSFGETTLVVPSRFRVKSASKTSFAGFDVSGHPDSKPVGQIYVEAKVSFGQILIRYE